VYVTEEQLEALGDDELALVISWFLRFHNNHLNRWRGGGPKDECYGCGDLDHFIAHCPKKNKHSFDKSSSSKYDSGKRKDKREYTYGKHKSKGCFNKEALEKKYLKKAKAQKHAFLASLRDLNNNSNDNHCSFPSSKDESERKHKDKLTGLCFIASSTHGGFCTMVVDEEVKASKDVASVDAYTKR
jgi:hypothetical protein